MLLFLDFETHYSRDYSLRKMDPASYILDPRFEVICMSVAFNHEPVEVIDGPDVDWFLKTVKQNHPHTTTVTYNALFDNAILAWRYNFVPDRMVDGLGMARSLLGSRLRKLGLKDVAEHLKVGAKGTEINETVGLHRDDLVRDKDLWARFRAYCANDTALLRDIFVKLHQEFPRDEYPVMDAVLRTCIEPVFHCDLELLQKRLEDIRAEKAHLCLSAGLDKDLISGNQSFIAALQAEGVVIKTKPGKRGDIPAIAKTDAWMQELLEDENPRVQCLAAARLGVKSTLEEKRSERLISIASLPWPSQAPMMPVPLRYSGAHTWRLSGDWRINMQNLPSARTGNPVLRKALLAPPGYKVVVGDLAQIEARLVAWFCQADTLTLEFKEKRDPYVRLAEQIFEMPVDRDTMQGVARHIGKAGILGCGYGMGPDKFYESVLRQARSQLKAHQLEQLNAIWTPDLAKKSVYAYRNRYSAVRDMWGILNAALEGPWLGTLVAAPFARHPISIFHRDGMGIVSGPGGREIRYPSPMVKDGEFWWFSAGVPHKIYGAALLENVIQFLARIVMFEAAMRLKEQAGLRFIHQVHDELVFIVPDAAVSHTKMLLHNYLTTPPSWAPELPLDCDVGSAQRYGDCK